MNRAARRFAASFGNVRTTSAVHGSSAQRAAAAASARRLMQRSEEALRAGRVRMLASTSGRSRDEQTKGRAARASPLRPPCRRTCRTDSVRVCGSAGPACARRNCSSHRVPRCPRSRRHAAVPRAPAAPRRPGCAPWSSQWNGEVKPLRVPLLASGGRWRKFEDGHVGVTGARGRTRGRARWAAFAQKRSKIGGSCVSRLVTCRYSL